VTTLTLVEKANILHPDPKLAVLFVALFPRVVGRVRIAVESR